jgi:hypothetical protein
MTERRELRFEMRVEEIFKLSDGRTVFTGAVPAGEDAILLPGACELLRDGKLVAVINAAPELFGEGAARGTSPLRALGTSDPVNISGDEVAAGGYVLTGRMRMSGHRHLVGIDSPPNHFVPDRMTLGPRLPEGWDGDAWTSPDESTFFLRAWNRSTGRFALGTGSGYEEARAALLREISQGGRPVVIRVQEATK